MYTHTTSILCMYLYRFTEKESSSMRYIYVYIYIYTYIHTYNGNDYLLTSSSRFFAAVQTVTGDGARTRPLHLLC